MEPAALPPPRRPHSDPEDWAPYDDRVHFETAEFLYSRNQMPASQINILLELWASTLFKHGEDAPFKNCNDVYDTIDSTPLGDVPWESVTLKYIGEQPQSDVPDWMVAGYDIWFRDSRTVICNLISNLDFNNVFDFSPYQEYDSLGNHRFCDFMSGNWVWKQAVRPPSHYSTSSFLTAKD